MTSPVDIRPDHLEIVQGILREHLPVGVKVWVFGSRANWTTKDSSDLDIALEGENKLSHKLLGALKNAFEDSTLPYTVDVVDLHAVSRAFKQIVKQQRVPFPALSASGHSGNAWTRVPLNDVIDLQLSSVDKKSKANEQVVQLCNYMDVYNNNFIHADMGFMAATATEREIAKCSLAAGDVVITKDSEKHDDIGVPALVREDIPDLVCGYHLAILRPSTSEIDGAYLFYTLSTDEAQRQFHSYANGITRFGLRKADIGLVEIPLPPLPEQRAIAHVLGTLDDKIELNRRMNETLEAMARALFKSWFVDFEPVRAKMAGRWHRGESLPGLPAEHYDLFPDRLVDSELGEVPEGWEVKALGEVVDLNPSEPMKRGTLAPYLDMAALPTSGSSPDTAVLREFKSGTRFRNGDTLLARITPCLENGKTAFVQSLQDGEVGWGSTEFIVMRAMPPVPPEYPYLLGRDVDFREHAIQSMTGTSGRQRVQVDALAPYPLSSPSAETWNEFSALVSPLFAQVEFNRKESLALVAQRDTLLPRLVSGEVGVENHNVTPQDAAR